jgi:hypothetical protein
VFWERNKNLKKDGRLAGFLFLHIIPILLQLYHPSQNNQEKKKISYYEEEIYAKKSSD